MMGINDGILAHPKFRRAVALAGSEAVHLWLGLRAYCAQQLTDGLIPDDMVQFVDGPLKPRARTNSITALRAVGLAHNAAERAECVTCQSAPPAASGIWLHDYLEHSESRERALQRRVNNRERQRQLRGLSPGVSQRDNTGDLASNTRHQANPSQANPSQSNPSQPEESARGAPQPAPAIWDPFMNPEETVFPDKFREKALERDNAVDSLTANLKVPRAVIIAELEDFCRYRECGAGMGDRRSFWLKHFRQHVLRRAKANELKPIGSVEHAATSETVERDARKQRNNALLAAAAAGDYGPDAQETARSGSKPDKAKLLSDIGNGLVRRIRSETAGLGEVLEQLRQEAS